MATCLRNLNRLSVVQCIDFTIVIIGSVVQIGDAFSLSADAKVLAYQKNVADFVQSDIEKIYASFYSHVPAMPDLTDNIQVTFNNPEPVISVNSISGLAISNSGVLMVGSINSVSNIVRNKHFRDFSQEEKPDTSILDYI
ncbi:spore germination protein GerPE [Bacillus sp. RG28]|uniref:Spore germination protein GerPE n=1 Tax=Gottfriedia endophytica TaxID=2820819 RepID=A0A940NI90_9BACI|nr:spore germination protein GerPE [Gottfriedia endophytica]MBP0724557.1 spore germination protein GerPE [Gottfriedia endophytica]